jgi:hypothetical protein
MKLIARKLTTCSASTESYKSAMTKPKLHLDADTSRRALLDALVARGHDVTRTPQDDLPDEASDDYQLLWATGHGRIIFTNNIRDFYSMTETYPNHAGIILTPKEGYSLSQLIVLLDRLLSQTEAEDWVGMVKWLSDWKDMLQE